MRTRFDLGVEGLFFVSAGTGTQHRVGHPVGSWFEKGCRRAVQRGRYAGSGFGNVRRRRGGTVRCATAPFVFSWGGPPRRSRGVHFHAMLSGNADAVQQPAPVRDGGFQAGLLPADGNDRVRCNIFARCRENFFPWNSGSKSRSQPFSVAQRTSAAWFTTRASKPREVSATYTIPERWAGAFGAAARASTGWAQPVHPDRDPAWNPRPVPRRHARGWQRAAGSRMSCLS